MSTGGGARLFELNECLGQGGFGEVYRATVTTMGGIATTAAVKLLRSDLGIDSHAVARLRDEGRVLARLNHPNIVKVHDLTVLEGRVALIMEYLRGDDLNDCLAEPHPMPLRTALSALQEVAHALEAAWEATGPGGGALRLIHRDIKPTNIRVGHHGEVKLLDFGIAWSENLDRESRTSSNILIGSLPYMAPERFVDRVAVPESDVFGLGCTLYEAVSGGQRFFVRSDLRTVTTLALDAGRYESYLAERVLAVGARRELRDLLHSTLAYPIEQRPSARELGGMLADLCASEQGPSLREWARGRSWPARESGWGPLVGQRLREGSLEDLTVQRQANALPVQEEAELPIEDTWSMEAPPAPRSTRGELVAVIWAGVMVGIAVVTALITLVLCGWWWVG